MDLAERARAAATLPNALHALSFTLALSLAFGTFNGTLFGWHPFAMSLGYLFFMAEGLLSAWAIRPALPEERVRGLEAHALMQLRALLFIAIGAAVIIHNKNVHGKPHFRTLHGKVCLSCHMAGNGHTTVATCSSRAFVAAAGQKTRVQQVGTAPTPHTPPRSPAPPPQLGLLTLVLTAASPLLGTVSFRKLGLIQRLPEQYHSRIKKAHRLVSARQPLPLGLLGVVAKLCSDGGAAC